MKATNDLQLKLLCRAIQEKGYHTGSVVFGVDRVDSDWDYVMTMEKAYLMYRALGIETFKPPKGDYAGSFISLKYLYYQTWINLILVPTIEDFDAWRYATTEMLKMDKELILVKKDRQRFFGWLLTEHYAFIPKGKHYKVALEMWGEGYVPRG